MGTTSSAPPYVLAMRITVCLLAVVFTALASLAQDVTHSTPPPDLKPERRVEGQRLSSAHDPAITLEFDKAFKYAGSQRFTLYGSADAEQHFFAEVDPDGSVKRLYWVQFESYLPSNDHTYNYQGKQVDFGGLHWFYSAAPRVVDPSKGRPDSDGAHALALFQKKGWRVPREVLMQRLVNITDSSNRKELMIIYAEDLSRLGYTESDLQKGGRAEAQAADVFRQVLDRSKAGMRVTSSKK